MNLVNITILIQCKWYFLLFYLRLNCTCFLMFCTVKRKLNSISKLAEIYSVNYIIFRKLSFLLMKMNVTNPQPSHLSVRRYAATQEWSLFI